MHLIIDTDAGVDDAQAIMLALAHPGVHVAAITTLTGNVHVDKVVPNVFTVLDVMGADVPVYRGAAHPLVTGYWQPEEGIHGSDGLGNLQNRPPTTRHEEPEPAALALVRLANEQPGHYTLVTLGPLTNVALACRLDPDFPLKIKRFVFMGGSISAIGNTPAITAEYNFYCDPEAARLALGAFADATMLSWEATMRNALNWDLYDQLAAINTTRGHFFRDITAVTSTFLRKLDLPGSAYMLPDPLAMAAALEPELVRESERHYVTAETGGTLTRGQGIVDYLQLTRQPANVDIIMAMDMDGIYALYERMLAG